MYKLINVSTGETVTTAEEPVTFGGPWGALDDKGNPTHEWQEVVPTADEIKQEKFDAINSEYQPKLAKMQDTLVYMQANGLDTAKLMTAYAATMSAYKTELAAVK